MTQVEKVEENSKLIDEMVQGILQDELKTLDNYLADVKTCFLSNTEVLDQDLNRIICQIPIYLYDLIEFNQRIEMKKGVSDEQSKYAKNEAILNATGTIADKTAQAENATIDHRLAQLAYKTASSIVQKKIEGAVAIYDAAKRVRQARDKEKSLTQMVGSSVGSF